MYKLLFLLAFSIFGSLAAQVNLVLNPSFEDTLDSNYNLVYPLCVDWWNPNDGTSDYFTPYKDALCANGCGRGGVRDVPCSSFGCMVAQDGEAYLGLVTYHSTGPGKEWAQGFLSETLKAGVSYCVGVWLASADSCGFKTCDFHVAFSSQNVNDGLLVGSFNFVNHVSFDISVINGNDWTYFEAQYTALGDEQFIYLGSNTPNEQILCAESFSNGWLWNSNYLLVDNVSVRINSECTIPSVNESGFGSDFLLHPNPAAGWFKVSFEGQKSANMRMVDWKGDIVLTEGQYLSEQQVETSKLQSGVYVVELFLNGATIRKRVMISH